MDKEAKIYVAGHGGLVGSAIVRKLKRLGYKRLIYKTRLELDLLKQSSVDEFFSDETPDFVFLAAAKVGGIYANSRYPADFIYQNLMMAGNIIHASYKNKVTRLLFLGSSCIYPKLAAQPMRENDLLTSALEKTNEPYAVAKIAGIKMCESYNRQFGTDFRSAMPTNLYGIGDNFHPENSHVIPGLMRRLHEAKINQSPTVAVWGSGNARREFLFSDDLAEACLYLMSIGNKTYQKAVASGVSHINVGTGKDVTINQLVGLIKKTVGFEGEVIWDRSKPDGPPRKLLDVSKLSGMGWSYGIELEDGLKKLYAWYKKTRS